jgi:hypothetical protein
MLILITCILYDHTYYEGLYSSLASIDVIITALDLKVKKDIIEVVGYSVSLFIDDRIES